MLMLQSFFCPECKKELNLLKNNLRCSSCKSDYAYNNGICIFFNESKNTKSDHILKNLVRRIDTRGYDSSVNDFLRDRPELRHVLTITKYDQSADIIFHGMSNKSRRCMEINSKWGNKSEILSNIFKQVYSVESNARYAEFQKRRFDEREITNVSIARCNVFKLPFPDDFFDLILCNDVLEYVARLFKDCKMPEAKVIKELKRVTSPEGRLIFGVGLNDKKINNTSYKQKLFERRKSSRIQKICKEMEMSVKSYWVLPSYERPYFSSSTDEKIVLRCFFENFETFVSSKLLPKYKKIILKLLKKPNYLHMIKLLQFFLPSFIICSKDNQPNDTIEDWIRKESGYENILSISRPNKLIFVLIDEFGNPKKKVLVKRFGYEFPPKLEFFHSPVIGNIATRCWMEDWHSGRPVNPLNENEVRLAIAYLLDFQ